MALEQGAPALRAFSPGYRDISGISPEELAKLERRRAELQRGISSERKVARVLSGLSVDGKKVVHEVHLNEHGSEEDLKEHDVTIETDIGTIWGQVKSSDIGIRSFKSEIAKKIQRLGMSVTVNEYLALNGLVVLNGQKSIESIQRSFLLQKAAINQIRQAAA